MKHCSGICPIVADLKASNILTFNPVISCCNNS